MHKNLYRINVALVMIVLLFGCSFGCKAPQKSSAANTKPNFPSGWPSDVPLMPGLTMTFAERNGDYIIVEATGFPSPPEVAQFYAKLSGWTAEGDTTWDQYGELPFRGIRKGNLFIGIGIDNAASSLDRVYEAGKEQRVEFVCHLK
jgi:hypothetical protein